MNEANIGCSVRQCNLLLKRPETAVNARRDRALQRLVGFEARPARVEMSTRNLATKGTSPARAA
jgi:hypothetical protein